MAEQFRSKDEISGKDDIPKPCKFSEDNDNTDSGITMIDVLEEEEDLENDANAVLGGSDDQNCTYIDGYVKRQALYACKTCTAKSQSVYSAGICLACSYACHEGHDLYELYTKRNFRCDCGNSKFSNNPCSLWKGKNATNEENLYNQNFEGKYCSCSRPYPDPDDEVVDEMIQCIMCEDWYHGRHLNDSVPNNDEFSELICSNCMSKNDFLRPYYVSPISTKVNADVKDIEVSVEEPENISIPNSTLLNLIETENQNEVKEENCDKECLLKTLPKVVKLSKGPCFWLEGWRNKLCKCKECIDLYEKNSCSFLLDPEDTVHAYEERGKSKQNVQSQYDKGLSALNALDRVKQVEAIHEYNTMKTELKDYLKTFVESKKVVREEDIHEFFNTMQAKKRQRTAYQVPHFCR